MIATMKTEQKGGPATQDPSLQDFATVLEERITGSRESFFYTADNAFERRQNREVEQREKDGEREFAYQQTIPILVRNLYSVESPEKQRIMDAVLGGVSYRITGIYVDLPGHQYKKESPLLADVAQDLKKYFNHN